MMFGKDEIKAIYFEGLSGFTQDNFYFIESDGGNILFKSKKPEVKITLKRDQLKAIDMLTEKEFYKRYLHVEKKPVRVMPKTFYIFRYVSSEGSDEKIIFYSYEMKVLKKMKKLIKEVGFNEPMEYSL